MATVQVRTGPGIGYLTSLLLPICDGVKLLMRGVQFNGVCIGVLALLFVNSVWLFVPFIKGLVSIQFNLFLFFLIISIVEFLFIVTSILSFEGTYFVL
jgi:hypothetical protein